MIRFEEDRSQEIALTLQKALNSGAVKQTMLDALPKLNIAKTQLKTLEKAIDNKSKIRFNLGHSVGKAYVPRYEVVIDFGTSEIHVKVKQNHVDMYADRFEVVK